MATTEVNIRRRH